MDKYMPPFSLTNLMVNYIGRISEKISKIDTFNLESKPILRRSNRIKSIYSSLLIEANTLNEEEVRDVINGKKVIGPLDQILEVKNAAKAYELIDEINVSSLKDLNRVHKVLTKDLVKEAGVFRKGEEGVFDGDRCIFMAPPARMVPELMEELFNWLKTSKDEIHPLIIACVFHYEFVFIHPFADGNGRMARLWQTAIMAKWNNNFKYIPIESQIAKFQNEYYEVISKCHSKGESTLFIEFMLKRIDEALDDILIKVKLDNESSKYVKRLLEVMDIDIPYSANELLILLNLKSKETLRRNYLDPAIDNEYVKMEFPEKRKSKNQRYIKQ